MHLILLPGLLLALAGGIWGEHSHHPAGISPTSNMLRTIPSLYSIAAQTATTATTTLAETPTQAITDTETLTSTATTTSTLAQTTPPPLPSASTGSNLRINPFDWDFLTSVPDPPLGPLAWAYIAVMLSLFWVCAYFYFFKRREWKGTNSVLRRAAERWGQIGLWIAGLGLLWAVFRVVHFDFFNLRFWFYLWALAALVAAGWFFYWYRTAYPKAMEKYLKTQRARQYMPGATKKGAASQRAGNPHPSQPAQAEARQGNKKQRKR